MQKINPSINEEKQDLSKPLPLEWTQASDLGLVEFYQSRISPPCCKIRQIFKYYKVQYKEFEGKKPGSDYKKIPVMVTNGIQINDSFIMIKNLARILDGVELTQELLTLEETNTFGTMIALELHVADSCNQIFKCAQILPCFQCFCGSICSCFLCCLLPGAVFKSKHPNLQNVQFYSDENAKVLGNKQFFHGDKPGIVDISLYGLLAPFLEGKLDNVNLFLGTSGKLYDWHQRMKVQCK